MQGTVFAAIGTVNGTDKLNVSGLNGKKILSESISDLKEAWQKPLRW